MAPRAPASPPAKLAAPPPAEPSAPLPDPPGLYVYGIASGPLAPLPAGLTGVDGSPVTRIRHGELAVLVHWSSLQPPAAEGEDQVVRRAQEHAQVLQVALDAYASVIPFQFGVIVAGGAALAGWLDANLAELTTIAERLRGHREYVVRVRPAVAATPHADGLCPADGGDAPGAGSGLAYLEHARDERDQTRAETAEAASLAERCRTALRPVTANIEDEGFAPGAGLLLKCACLVEVGTTGAFLAALEDIEASLAVRVEVGGPWPGYTFARRWAPSPGAAAR